MIYNYFQVLLHVFATLFEAVTQCFVSCVDERDPAKTCCQVNKKKLTATRWYIFDECRVSFYSICDDMAVKRQIA